MTTTAGRVCLGMLLTIATAATTAAQDRDFRLMSAAASQDRAAAIALLAEGVDVNAARADGATALLWAAHWDDADLVERLLAAGANVNLADDHGVTALERAAENASLAMVETLLAAGADVNAAQTSGLTPLMTASRTGNPGVVRALLAHGANADAAVTETGSTALMWAVSEPHPEIVGLLLDAGADPAPSTVKGFTPLMFAARNGDIETARTLIAAGVDVNAPSADGTHVLPFSIVSGQDAFALFLLEQGADPEGEMNGVRALHAAAGGVGTWLREWYARHGGNRLYSRRGRSRLATGRRLPLVEALLARGADPNARITASAMLMSYIGYPSEGGVRTLRLRHRRPARRHAAVGRGLRHERRGSRTFGAGETRTSSNAADPARPAGSRRGSASDDARRHDPVHGRGRSRALDLHAAAAARGPIPQRRGSGAGAAGGRRRHRRGERSRLHGAPRRRFPRTERSGGVPGGAAAPTSTRGTSADVPPIGWRKARSSRSSSRAGRRPPPCSRSWAPTRRLGIPGTVQERLRDVPAAGSGKRSALMTESGRRRTHSDARPPATIQHRNVHASLVIERREQLHAIDDRRSGFLRMDRDACERRPWRCSPSTWPRHRGRRRSPTGAPPPTGRPTTVISPARGTRPWSRSTRRNVT